MVGALVAETVHHRPQILTNCGVNSIVKVAWLDTHSDDAWENLANLDGTPKLCESVGFLVKNTESYVSVAGTIGVNDVDACCIIHIPKVCIEKITVLSKPR